MNAPNRVWKTGFAHWEDRIAPVFDTAQQILIVESESGRIICERQEFLPVEAPFQRALRLAEWGVSELVCGAISRETHALVAAYGIEVVSFIAGDLRDIITAWQLGELGDKQFTMPGCCGGQRRLRRRRGRCAGADMNAEKIRRRQHAKRR